MQDKITVEDGYLVIRVPMKTARLNPYDDHEEEMDAVVGVIAGNELGFANWIDRSYKGKGDDVSVNFYNEWSRDKKEFTALCMKLGIEVYVYELCSKCHEPLIGTFTWNDGPVCFKCAKM